VQAILSLIRDYEEICMPFSHLEYPLSSRKKIGRFCTTVRPLDLIARLNQQAKQYENAKFASLLN